MAKWSVHPSDTESASQLSKALGVTPCTAQILMNRGLSDAKDAQRFLRPDLSQLTDPSFLPDMDLAVERIVRAIKKKESIALYGDYDVDGITGVALFTRFLRSLSVEPLVHIPNRLTEGYGLSNSGLEELKKKGVSLVITVDCGTRSKKELAHARELGLDVIVTDHHEVEELFEHNILLNPKRPDVKESGHELAGCGVVFLLLMALRKRLRDEGLFEGALPNLKDHLDLVALGTIADVVPLTGMNRIFAKFGMEVTRTSTKPGIRSLITVSGLDGQPIRTGNIAFRLAPRINAAGRMGDSLPSFELLTTDDPAAARDIALQLNKLNGLRQSVEEKALGEAVEHIEENHLHTRAAIVVADKRWHAGVIGIVASKLVDRYGLPAIVISSLDKRSKGSARSIQGINIVEVLSRCSDLLERFGGHAQAAGIIVDDENIEAFRTKFEACCAEVIVPEEALELDADVEIAPQDMTKELARELELLEPFGIGNPEPTLLAHGLKVVSARIVGGGHLKMKLASPGTKIVFDAIGFDLGDRISEMNGTVSAAFIPQMNVWNGIESLQLKIKDIFPCSK